MIHSFSNLEQIIMCEPMQRLPFYQTILLLGRHRPLPKTHGSAMGVKREIGFEID
jgi:hypothetical protein